MPGHEECADSSGCSLRQGAGFPQTGSLLSAGFGIGPGARRGDGALVTGRRGPIWIWVQRSLALNPRRGLVPGLGLSDQMIVQFLSPTQLALVRLPFKKNCDRFGKHHQQPEGTCSWNILLPEGVAEGCMLFNRPCDG